MKKKRILLIAERSEVEKYRTKRIIEEAQKVKCDVDLVCSNKTSILVNEAIYEGKSIDFSLYNVVYSLGNSFYHHYLLQLAKSFDVLTWPSTDHLNLSDKFTEGIFFNSINIPTPKTILLSSKDKEKIEKLAEKVEGFPCVLKKVTGSEGRYVALANSSHEVLDFVGRMPQGITGKKNILIQEYIKESKGTDFRVYCVGGEILGAIKRESEKDFRANISLGGVATKIDPEETLIEYSKKIMKEGKFLFAGIDFIKSERGYLVIEINTSADFQGFEKATGINVAAKIIDKLLKQV